MEPGIQLLIITLLLAVCSAISTRSFFVSGLVVASFLAIILPLRYGLSNWSVSASLCSFLIFLTALYFSLRKKLFSMEKDLELKRWRILARPFAMLFIPIGIYAGQRFLIFLLGVLSALFISIDLYRLISRREMSLFFKKNEYQRFSSMTSFLVAVFFVFLLFPEEVSFLCLTFIIFGDMAAKLAGIKFGRQKLVHDKTLEGSLGFFTGCIYAGFMICSLFDIELSFLLIGALCAATTELFSFHVDDNFTVGMITGGCLQALKFFHVI